MSSQLKDKKGNWVADLEITEGSWKTLMQETLNGVFTLLGTSEKLLASGGNAAICAGLYTYAVEEYGKILLLKKYSPDRGKVIIKYRNEFRKHSVKFNLAVRNLPDECKKLHEAAFAREVFSSEVFDATNVIADLEARMAVFYSDLADSGKGIIIRGVPEVDQGLLQRAIRKLQAIAFEVKIP